MARETGEKQGECSATDTFVDLLSKRQDGEFEGSGNN